MRMRSPASVFLIGLALAACHTITEELPQQEAPLTPQTMPPVQAPVIVIPVPSATPPPAPANPAPNNPAPTNPTPAPNNPPQTQGCPLPAGTWNENCSMQQQSFLGRVEAAIDEVIASDPQAFDTSRTRGCANCYFVRDPTRYVTRVAQAITRNGVCGHYDGEELAVKNSNAFNDQYDILTSDMFIRRQGGSYRSTCRPAWF
jgi:hypothetical protein